jgi:hypothetical protein
MQSKLRSNISDADSNNSIAITSSNKSDFNNIVVHLPVKRKLFTIVPSPPNISDDVSGPRQTQATDGKAAKEQHQFCNMQTNYSQQARRLAYTAWRGGVARASACRG